MTDQQARYDRIAEGYARWWAPIHRPATLRLLDEIAPDLGDGPARIVDVGCGTGAFEVAAVGRWPTVDVDGVDVSAGMLVVAGRSRARLPRAQRDRMRLVQGAADALPFPDATFDLAVTAFVLQLVPSRHRALREIRRVLRPGGRLMLVTWLQGDEPFGADIAYDEALAAAGLEPRDVGGGHDDIPSPAAAAAILRRAGFTDARARADTLAHQFTPEGYLGFVSAFDDEDRFAALEPAKRAALEADLLARLHALPPEGMRLELPIVYATARRSAPA